MYRILLPRLRTIEKKWLSQQDKLDAKELNGDGNCAIEDCQESQSNSSNGEVKDQRAPFIPDKIVLDRPPAHATQDQTIESYKSKQESVLSKVQRRYHTR